MGWLSWLRGPTDPAGRIDEARRMLTAGRFNDARHAVADLIGAHPEARGVAGEAAAGLCRINIEAAVAHARSGNGSKADDHLALAAEFRGQAAEFGADVAPLDLLLREGLSSARDELRGPSPAPAAAPREAARNPFERDDATDETAMRLALVAEGLPPALRAGFRELGPVFSAAVLDREDGRHEAAIQALATLDDAPLVWWERAQNAFALRDHAAAIRAAREFAATAAGHQRMGNLHTGEWLAARLAENGEVAQALALVRTLRASDPGLARFLHASLLEANGELAQADALLVSMSRDMPNEMAIYAMLGRIRVAGGQRAEAMRALEAAMTQCACGTGKCGSPSPSLAIVRPLATLYLEDGIDPARGRELAAQARAMAQKPAWEDVYLAALERRGTPEGSELAATLRERTPPDDPRAERLRRFLWADAAPS